MFFGGQSFLRKFLQDPARTGALSPATRSLSRTVARATRTAYDGHRAQSHANGRALKLIELGAGTGALTRSISPLNPVLVEQDEAWASRLRTEFPSLEVRAECATETLRALAEPVGVVSSIPLLNNPQASEIKRLLAEGYANGLIKFCVLYTYGWADPLLGAGFGTSRRHSFVARSFPPASVWVYR
jgi:phosphatidylethanolamine/phosphatidyl-N-methylethanolamine N-methyltransferase